MNIVSSSPALSEAYSDIIVHRSLCQNRSPDLSACLLSSSFTASFASSSASPSPSALPAQPVSGQYEILYAPLSAHLATVEEVGYASVPKLFTEINVVSLEEAGILPVRIQSFAEWTGKEVLMGFLDSGIDYTHPAFRNADGTTRILRLWDQADTSGLPPAGISYGTEYTENDINRMLFSGTAMPGSGLTLPTDISGRTLSNDPFAANDTASALSNSVSAVVSIANVSSADAILPQPATDPQGHGTAVAGIACGSPDAGEGFTGIAPESSIAFVRLKSAKQYLRDYFRIPPDARAFQENDLMLGIRYLSDCASALGMPLVICMSLGSSQGGHTGHTPLEELINEILYVPYTPTDAGEQERTVYGETRPCVCTITGTGNETGLDHHYFGRIQTRNRTGALASEPVSAGTAAVRTDGTGTSVEKTVPARAANRWPVAERTISAETAGTGYPELISFADVELLIEQETDGFTIEFWADAPDLYTLGFTSPIGETISSVRPENGSSREFSFLLERSRILLTWSLTQNNTRSECAQVALIRFTDPTPGIWAIHVGSLKAGDVRAASRAPGSDAPVLGTPDSRIPAPWTPDFRIPASGAPGSDAPVLGAPDSGIPAPWAPDSGAPVLGTPDSGISTPETSDSGPVALGAPDSGAPASGVFHLWLPVSGLIDPWIHFLTPDANMTLVTPSCASSAVTVGAWDAYTGSLYPHSGRGYTRNGHIKPDLASPGVRVTAPGINGSYVSLTGSCAASALTAGAAALLLSAGLRQNPPRYFSSEEVKQFLLQGVQQRKNENYPNQAWGYGTLDLGNTFRQRAYDTL